MNRTIFFAFVLGLLAVFGAPDLVAQDLHGEGHVQSTMEMDSSEFFIRQFVHLVPHPVFGGGHENEGDAHAVGLFTFYDVNLFQLIALGIILVLFLWVAGSFNSSNPPWLVRVLRGWVHWIRDEVVYKNMGKEEGERFAPFFVFLFFFILVMNLLGLIPGSVTATATAYVTGALAIMIFGVMVGGGMMKQGPVNYLKHLLPGGLPTWLIPLMAIVELIGLFVKPFALMIRLFANMLAGHLLIYSFIGMIFIFAKQMDMGAVAYIPAVLTAAMAIFINIIEAFVVVLQAFIFVFLSVLFVQDSLHPSH